MKKVLFIDRDGTLVLEPEGYQLDSLSKLEFYPKAFQYMAKIAKELDYELAMVTNQDGLGTDSFPEETFWPTQNFILRTKAFCLMIFLWTARFQKTMRQRANLEREC